MYVKNQCVKKTKHEFTCTCISSLPITEFLNMRITTGVTVGVGIAYHSGAHELIHYGYSCVCVAYTSAFGACSVVLSTTLCRVVLFSFGHCIVCSSIYGV